MFEPLWKWIREQRAKRMVRKYEKKEGIKWQ